MVDFDATSAGDSGRALARLSDGQRRLGLSVKDAQQRAQPARCKPRVEAQPTMRPSLGE